jgi:hypothetical protein
LPHAAHIKSAGKERLARAESSTSAAQQYANMDSELLAKVVEQIISQTDDVGTAFPEEGARSLS